MSNRGAVQINSAYDRPTYKLGSEGEGQALKDWRKEKKIHVLGTHLIFLEYNTSCSWGAYIGRCAPGIAAHSRVLHRKPIFFRLLMYALCTCKTPEACTLNAGSTIGVPGPLRDSSDSARHAATRRPFRSIQNPNKEPALIQH